MIPVLVQGAAMPSEEELPPDLQALAWRNAAELRRTRWEADLAELAGFVTKRLVTAGGDQRAALNTYAGTIEGDKIDMVLAIEDAASSQKPVSFVLSRLVD